MNSHAEKFPIVGVGASAGGIQALEGFFRGLEADCEMAVVIVTHLNPDRESLLHEIVGRYTHMPVSVAEDGVGVEPGQVYVMPPNTILTIESGHLRVRRLNALQRERKPVDIFFSALAKDQGEYAVGIVLSGGDGDGTLGVKMIKEWGGMTFAQVADGSGPSHPDMPQTAISSGVIDLALPAEKMGARLAQFARSLDRLDVLAQDESKSDDDALKEGREAIYALLHNHSGHDFSGYKTKTFLRRVRRRMQVVQLDSLDAYVERLRKDPAEVTGLFRDLLINVTNFFRDSEAFKALEDLVIPRLFDGRGIGETVRVWVPGCATGEEVFSLAILMREHMSALPVAPRVQIFATDIDEPALAVARAARYPEAMLESVSAERRQRFFHSDGATYAVTKDVREMCVFSPHSVIRDPPFSRMDLVSCRNLLIYLGPEIQAQIIPTFHYSLRPGGYLFLGTSESIGQHRDLFATVDKKGRIFQSRESSEAPALPPIVIGGAHGAPKESVARSRSIGSYPLRQAVEAQVMDRFAPAHVVVNAVGDIVHYSARTGKYLEPPQGAPHRQLAAMARKGLRLELRSALREAMETRQTVTRRNVIVDEDDDRIAVITLAIEPLVERGHGELLYLVLFIDSGPTRSRTEAENNLSLQSNASQAELERELRETRERLQGSVEEYETALEELKSSHEELTSINEEAQSSNEELEASKEELQSLNEELNTINAELNEKVEELARAHDDLKNLFNSTQVATVFLDNKLAIRSFTPGASKFFNLRAGDVGRPLTDLAGHLAYPELHQHIQLVFNAGEMIEHKLAANPEGRHHLVRLIPYKDGHTTTQGVVVTIVDVTSLTEAETHQKVLIAELNHRVKNMLAVVISILNQTMEKTPSPELFYDALIGRLNAMARAYALLSRENWNNVSVDNLVHQELDPFGERIVIMGPDIRLNAKQCLCLSMVLHELATNAAKYGALSVSGGRVDLAWNVTEQDRRFALRWRENGGPRVAEPTRQGFGLELVQRQTEYNLGGQAKIDFAPEGLAVALSFPLG